MVLTNKYNLKVSIEKRKNNQYRLYVHKNSLPNLRTLVIPHIIPIYLYKVYGIPKKKMEHVYK